MSFAEDPAKFIGSDATVADKIRALDAAGYSRAEIARMLGKRYQHVRNVLEGDKLKRPAPRGPLTQARAAEVEALSGGGLRIGDIYRLPITADGSVRLPVEAKERFGWRDGGVVVARLQDEAMILLSPQESLRQAQALVRPWRPGEPLLSEELIADRRREASKEDGER